jgi:hypothetical protein
MPVAIFNKLYLCPYVCCFFGANVNNELNQTLVVIGFEINFHP